MGNITYIFLAFFLLGGIYTSSIVPYDMEDKYYNIFKTSVIVGIIGVVMYLYLGFLFFDLSYNLIF